MKVRNDEGFLFPSSQLDFRGGLGRIPDDQIKMVQTRFGLQSLYMDSGAVNDLKAQYPDLPIDANGDLPRSTFLRFYISKVFPNPTTDYDKKARAEYEQIIADLIPFETNFQAAKAASDAAAPLRDALAQVEAYVRAVSGANSDIRSLAQGLRQQGDSLGARTLETIGDNLIAQANQVLANAQAAAAAGNLSAVQQYSQAAVGLLNDIRHQVQVSDSQLAATAAEVQRQQKIAADIAAADLAEQARANAANAAAAAAAQAAAQAAIQKAAAAPPAQRAAAEAEAAGAVATANLATQEAAAGASFSNTIIVTSQGAPMALTAAQREAVKQTLTLSTSPDGKNPILLQMVSGKYQTVADTLENIDKILTDFGLKKFDLKQLASYVRWETAAAAAAAAAAATQTAAVNPATGTVQHTDTTSGTTSTVNTSTGTVAVTTPTGQTVTGTGSVNAGGVITTVDTKTGTVTTQNTQTGVVTQTDASTGKTVTAVQITGTSATGGTFMTPGGTTVTTTTPITQTTAGLDAGKLALIGLVGLLLLRGAIK